MIAGCAKRAMPDWYKQTAIQQIRPVQVDELISQKFWQKWNQVDEQQLPLSKAYSRSILGKITIELVEILIDLGKTYLSAISKAGRRMRLSGQVLTVVL